MGSKAVFVYGSAAMALFTSAKAEAFFYVSSDRMNQAAGESYCSDMGMSLAAIYDEGELAVARQAIEDAGIEKAITAASSDGYGNGWRWLHHDEVWERDGFPYNTGKVEDQVDGMDEGIYSLHRASDGFVWDADGTMEEHPVLCRGMGHAPTFFSVSSDWMNQAAGDAYCSDMGMSLAAIYDEGELAVARQAIEDAGIEKAITAARSDGYGNGWRWLHHDEDWERDGFPYNTGKVEDQADGMDDGIYSLHRASDGFVWDADGTTEEHPVLCRGMGQAPPQTTRRPCVQVSQSAVNRIREMGYEPRTCESMRRLRRLKGLNPGPPCPTQKGKKNTDNMMEEKENPFSSIRKGVPKMPKLRTPFLLRGSSKVNKPVFQV